MTNKQITFCDEYLTDLNATRAYMVAYPKVKNENTAAAAASRLLGVEEVKVYIDERLAAISDAKIAKTEEVMQYLTSVMRREHKEVIVVTLTREESMYVPDETGKPRKQTVKTEVPELVEIPAKLSDANKAAELLGKAYGLYTDKIETDVDMELNISIDYGDEDEDENN